MYHFRRRLNNTNEWDQSTSLTRKWYVETIWYSGLLLEAIRYYENQYKSLRVELIFCFTYLLYALHCFNYKFNLTISDPQPFPIPLNYPDFFFCSCHKSVFHIISQLSIQRNAWLSGSTKIHNNYTWVNGSELSVH